MGKCRVTGTVAAYLDAGKKPKEQKARFYPEWKDYYNGYSKHKRWCYDRIAIT